MIAKEDVLDIILTSKVVAVIRMSDTEKLRMVVESIQKGGVRAIEITMTVPGAVAIIRELSRSKPEGVIVGAGTVLDGPTASRVIEAGADFVVSPVTDLEMIETCREHGRCVIPGALTPTEIVRAWDSGADIVKIFPATSVGPGYFKDIKAPLPQIRLMPTGGVDSENAREFIANGACCVGIGTALLDKRAIEEGRWEELTGRAKALIQSLA